MPSRHNSHLQGTDQIQMNDMSDFQASGFDRIGRFQDIYLVSDEMGLEQRPTILITEFGWETIAMPDQETALQTLASETGALYALYPEVRGVAIWGLGGWQGSLIGEQIDDLMEPLIELALETRYTIPAIDFPVIPAN